MTTATAQMVRPAISGQRWTKLLAPLGGLALIGGLIALFATPAGEDTGETPAEVVAYAASHESWTIVTLLFGIASIALSGAFVAGVYSRLQRLATSTEAALVLIGGIMFTLCFALCWVVWGAPLADMPDESARALAHAEAYLSYRRHRLVPARRRRDRRRRDGRSGLARRQARRAPGLARLARRRARDRVARDGRLPRHVRLDGLDRARLDRDVRGAIRGLSPSAVHGGGLRRSSAGPPPRRVTYLDREGHLLARSRSPRLGLWRRVCGRSSGLHHRRRGSGVDDRRDLRRRHHGCVPVGLDSFGAAPARARGSPGTGLPRHIRRPSGRRELRPHARERDRRHGAQGGSRHRRGAPGRP